MKRWVWIGFLCLAGCAATTPALTRENRADGYEAIYEDIPEGRVSKFDLRIPVDAAPWRLWNIMFTDAKRMAEISGGVVDVREFEYEGKNQIRLTFRLASSWFLPSIEVKTRWHVNPAQFSFDQTCLGGAVTDCYIRVSMTPMDNGARTMYRYQGYIRRPWYLSHAAMVENQRGAMRSLSTNLALVAQQPAYGNRNQQFPWDELNAFSAAPAGQAAASLSPAEQDAAKPRLLIQDLKVSEGTVTDATVVRLASAYLAEQLSHANRFAVSTDWDVQLMAKYLRSDWLLNCREGHESEKCQERINGLAQAKYVLGGEIARTQDRYLVSLVLLNADQLTATWRLNREIPASSPDLRSLIAEAAEQLVREPFVK